MARRIAAMLAIYIGWVSSAVAFQCALNSGMRLVGQAASLRRHVAPLRGNKGILSNRVASAKRSSRMEMRNAPLDFTVEPMEDKIPITILSGFLGAGKTTLLRTMLQNRKGLKVGVVVNDMAAINIDAKLVKSDSTRPKGDPTMIDSPNLGGLLDTSDVLELQNGCACCSASDELLMSVMKLLLVSAEREEPYDRIVIEMTGVGEPKNIRKQFFDAGWASHPALEYAELKNMVTVVDSANFLHSFESADAVIDRPDLVEEESQMGAAERAIVDLLTEQVEVADYVLLNKADLLDKAKLTKVHALVSALNPGADVITCTYGQVELDVVLGSKRDRWVADKDDEDDFRLSVQAANKAKAAAAAAAAALAAAGTELGTKEKDSSAVEQERKGEGGGGHEHAHEQEHPHPLPHAAHEHEGEECALGHEDMNASHEESHAHAHAHEEAGEKQLVHNSGWIPSSFVYSRRRPFHPERLKALINKLPVGSSGQDADGLAGWVVPDMDAVAAATRRSASNPLQNVVRSKGFVWVSSYHRVALYWSHAGQFFDLKDFGMFWAATPLKFWPRDSAERAQVVADFGMGEKWGDRRQELVFIGVGLDEAKITALLDQALLNDEEMREYEKSNYELPDKVKMDWTTSPPIPVEVRPAKDQLKRA